jgi:hypothetical protein
MSDKKWKNGLLSSSLPLEYEVAKILVAKGFAVEADYTYARDAEGKPKDFSVDINATGHPPFDDPDRVDGLLELLIECKYRVDGTKWLFLPDVNKPGFSKIYLGCALRAFDDFSTVVLDKEPTYDFTRRTPCCYKGIEVQQAGGVYDAELRHGVEQLRFAMPRLMISTMMNNMMFHDEDNHPFLICPILLTNAELLVLNKNLSVARVRAADDPAELGRRVPYLILYSGYGPDFETHCKNESSVMVQYVDHNKIKALDDLRGIIRDGYRMSRGPVEFMKGMASANDTYMGLYFTQFVVCSMDGFGRFIDKVKSISKRVIESQGPFGVETE